MNLFSRFSAAGRAFKAGGSVEQRSLAGMLSWLADYNGENGGGLSDPYNLSPWVSSAINHIARPIADMPLEFSEKRVDGSATVISDAVLSAFWDRPARGRHDTDRLSCYDAIEATVGWLCLKGSFAWVLDDTWTDSKIRDKSPFLIVNPERLKPIRDRGEMIGWRLSLGNGRHEALIPSQVIESAFWNPTSNDCGSSPMSAAKLAAEADFALARFWKNLAEANGDLGETVIAPNGISPDQEEQVKLMLRRKREAAKKGKYLPQFLVGDLKTEAPKIQSPDSSSVTQRLQNRHEVYIAFGVPPSYAEVTASYSIGSASDRYKLIMETCMPISRKISEAVESVCAMLAGRAVSARFNFDDHPTMQEVRSERIKTGRELHERGMPWDVVSEYLGLRLPKFPGSDKSFLPFALQEVGSGALPDDPAKNAPAPIRTKALEAIEELEVLLRGCPAHPPQQRGGAPAKRTDKAKLWEARMRTRAPYMRKIRVAFDRALYEARKETLANIDAVANAEKSVRAGGAFDFLFDLTKFLELIIEPIFRVNVAAYEAAGAELMKEDLGLDDPFIPADPAGLAWLQARKNFIRDAGVEVWEEIRDTLDEGIQAGESYDKLSDRVRETFNGISKEKSMRIAKTETGIAFESGRHEAMVQAGAEWKEWVISGLENVRDTHRALDGKVIPIAEPFIVGGVPMQYPCDPDGTAAEIINCNCIHGPAMEPEAPDIEGNNPDIGIPY